MMARTGRALQGSAQSDYQLVSQLEGFWMDQVALAEVVRQLSLQERDDRPVQTIVGQRLDFVPFGVQLELMRVQLIGQEDNLGYRPPCPSYRWNAIGRPLEPCDRPRRPSVRATAPRPHHAATVDYSLQRGEHPGRGVGPPPEVHRPSSPWPGRGRLHQDQQEQGRRHGARPGLGQLRGLARHGLVGLWAPGGVSPG